MSMKINKDGFAVALITLSVFLGFGGCSMMESIGQAQVIKANAEMLKAQNECSKK